MGADTSSNPPSPTLMGEAARVFSGKSPAAVARARIWSSMSTVISALLVLCGTAGLWFYGSYRRAMKRAQGAILDSQKRVLDAAQDERDQTEVRLHSVETEIDELGLSNLGAAVDAAFGDGGPVPPDDADG